MPELHGPLQEVTVTGTLWLVLVFPLVAAIACGVAAVRVPNPPGPPSQGRGERVRNISVAAMGLAFIASVAHAVRLGVAPEHDRFLLQHLFRMVRLGQLDASFDLALDPLASTMTLVVTSASTLIFVYAAAYMKDDRGFARFFAWLNLFVFAMLLLVLADNLLLLFFGWEGVGLCSWALIGFWWDEAPKATAGRKAFLVNRIGDAGFLLGVSLLFWALGGTWSASEYTPDLNARFASVAVRATHLDDDAPHAALTAPGAPATDDDDDDERAPDLPATPGKGLLTLTAYPGALVYMDDARTPLLQPGGEPLRAPFSRVPVPGGIHTFRIHPGVGLDDYLVSHVTLGDGREIALAPFGPTVTFRQLRDALVAKDARGRAAVRDAFVAKRAFGRVGVVTLACLLLFVGAVGKSAQVPLYVWLPDAMAGPTPVSALIHAATMVTAGVYMLARLGFLFALSPTASTVVAIVGAGTALYAALVGFFQTDIKRVLAFSTVSQLGFMILGAGAGASDAAVFHLVTHAFFKACLFLAAGSVIHGMQAIEPGEDGAQDLRRMGGLAKAMPRTARAYFVACLAITSAPIPGLAGFWSKDDILRATWSSPLLRVPGPLLFGVALVAAGFTSFYMWRSYYLAFEGPAREGAKHVHESPAPMVRVLDVLAILSAVTGVVLGASTKLFGKEGESLLEAWLAPVTSFTSLARGIAEHGAASSSLVVEWAVIASSVGVALAGWSIAQRRYGAQRPADWADRERRAPLHAPIAAAFHVDAVYAHLVVAPLRRLSDLLAGFDQWVVDGLVNFAAIVTKVTAWIAGRADADIVDGAVRHLSEATLGAGARLRTLQTGRIQTYVYAIVLGALTLAFVQYWLR